MSGEQAIFCEGITKTYGEGEAAVKALRGIDFTAEFGEIVALVGPSGCGKTTLISIFAAILSRSSGALRLAGADPDAMTNQERTLFRREKVGFIFQQFNLVNRLPVITNVLIGLLHETPWWRSLLMRFTVKQRQAAIEALASVGIEQTAWQRASTLSGGQQQRAALARCLVQKAKIILADEPIASLDPESSRIVMNLLQKMNQDYQCTVLVSLHQVEFAVRYCKRTIALNAGRVVYDGPSSALTPQLLAELYGSSAQEFFQTQALADPSIGNNLHPMSFVNHV